MKQLTKEKLNQVLTDHKLWDESGGEEGKQADLSYINLCSTDLNGIDLCEANLRHADLSYADLWHTNLERADLSHANLEGADLYSTNFVAALLPATLKIHQAEQYTAYIQPTYTWIGCEYHTNKEWRNFTDEEIDRIDPCLTEWWGKNKEIIFHSMSEVEKLDMEK